MLNSEKAIFAMNDVDDNHLESARELLGYRTGYAVKHPMKKRIITFALAAALILVGLALLLFIPLKAGFIWLIELAGRFAGWVKFKFVSRRNKI
jgi:hypothetical protein